MSDALLGDVEAVGRIPAVPTILEVVCRVTGMGFAAVARVTDSRWMICAVRDEIAFGLSPGGELPVETTICHEIRQSGSAVTIDEVAGDPLFRNHRTPAIYGFESYISVPIIRADGSFFGTLCAIDPRPARLKTPEVQGMFRLFAELIAFHLEAAERLARSEKRLADERAGAELREQFIAVLGHDLRNPLAAVASGVTLLQRTTLDERARGVVERMRQSAARMSGLIDNVLDFARGRLGGGLVLERQPAAPLGPVLEQVVAELQASHPGREIALDIALSGPVDCDRGRIGQLLSNLLANALTHGAADTPIQVRASDAGGVFDLSVANHGEPIPAAAMDRLFQPFTRGAGRSGQQGLGLGLYISHEVARAHGGTLEAISTQAETRFRLRMPANRH